MRLKSFIKLGNEEREKETTTNTLKKGRLCGIGREKIEKKNLLKDFCLLGSCIQVTAGISLPTQLSF